MTAHSPTWQARNTVASRECASRVPPEGPIIRSADVASEGNGNGSSTTPLETPPAPETAPPTEPKPDRVPPPTIPDPVQPPQKKKSSFAGVLSHKLMDTGDDILMHFARWGRSDAQDRTDGSFVKGTNGMDRFVANKPVILVLGFGWAAHSLSKVRFEFEYHSSFIDIGIA
jgi:hypothetical protein